MKLYHGTTDDRVRDIMLNGFQPESFFTTDLEYAKEFASNRAKARGPYGRSMYRTFEDILRYGEAPTQRRIPIVIEADIPNEALEDSGDFYAFGWGSPLGGPGNYEKLKNGGRNYRNIKQVKPRVRFIRV